jgi:hypothetical protein
MKIKAIFTSAVELFKSFRWILGRKDKHDLADAERDARDARDELLDILPNKNGDGD